MRYGRTLFSRAGAEAGSWRDRMLARKPLMLVAMVLANKMALSIRATRTKETIARNPASRLPEQQFGCCGAWMGGHVSSLLVRHRERQSVA